MLHSADSLCFFNPYEQPDIYIPKTDRRKLDVTGLNQT